MSYTRRFTRRLRKVIDEPGLQAAIAADLNIVTSSGGGSEGTQRVDVQQRRSDRTAAESPRSQSPDVGGPDRDGHNPEKEQS